MDKKESYVFSSVGVELAEHQTHLKVTNRLCYYDAPNGNNVLLPYDDKAEELAQTIVNMPVKAKYRPNKKGEPDLGGHEAVKRNGEIEFKTVPIGTHEKAYIKEEEVSTFSGEKKKLHVLYADQIIWKENKNVVSAIRRLYDAGNLHSSWELQGYEYSFKEGVKRYTDYAFLANVYLGENVAPAYGNMASVTAISAVEPSCETLISEALALDMAEKEEQDGEVEKEMENETIVSEETSEKEEVVEAPTEENQEISEKESTEEATEETEEIQNEEASVESSEEETSENQEEEPEQSALTGRDIMDKINHKLYESNRHVFMWFPEEKTIWAKPWDGKETKVYVYTYVVENEEVILSEPVEKELVVSMLEANEEVASLRGEVDSLKQQNAEYAKYKEIVEKAEAEKLEAERKSKIEALRNKAIESECFTVEEISEFDNNGFFNELKENELNAKIVERMMAKNAHTKEVSSKETEKKEEKIPVKSVIETSENVENPVAVLRGFLFGKK